jgi:hypothetical protein
MALHGECIPGKCTPPTPRAPPKTPSELARRASNHPANPLESTFCAAPLPDETASRSYRLGNRLIAAILTPRPGLVRATAYKPPSCTMCKAAHITGWSGIRTAGAKAGQGSCSAVDAC